MWNPKLYSPQDFVEFAAIPWHIWVTCVPAEIMSVNIVVKIVDL